MGARVVVDTNILVSALGWRGAPHRLVQACLAGRHQLLLSPAILSELAKVLRYPKLGFKPGEILAYLETLGEAAEMVTPAIRLEIVKEDPDDDKFLECALEGRAQALVTGDSHLANLVQFEGIPILTAADFLQRFEDEP
jgi:putative PIN family toxin of toxin-antitoxin system